MRRKDVERNACYKLARKVAQLQSPHASMGEVVLNVIVKSVNFAGDWRRELMQTERQVTLEPLGERASLRRQTTSSGTRVNGEISRSSEIFQFFGRASGSCF